MDVLNFGRRIPEQPIAAPEVVANFEADKRVPKKLYSTTSKYLFREINLFVPEAILVGISAVVGVVCLVIALLFRIEVLYFVGIIVPIGAMTFMFILRLVLFTPNRNRFLTQRVMRSGAIRFSVDNMQSKEIIFDKAHITEKVGITNPRKHYDFNTGKPVVILKEGAAENVSINDGQDVSQQAKDFSNVADSIWGTASTFTKYNMIKGENKKSIIIIIMLIMVLVVIAVIAFFVIGQSGMLNSLIAGATLQPGQTNTLVMK